jgi:3-hydroxyisobutyrate dehydrogenase
MQVGIAGIGKMGAAIAQRLIAVGHQVTAWNRTPDKLQAVTNVGAAVAAMPTDFANRSQAKLIADDTEKWAKVIKFAGIRAD